MKHLIRVSSALAALLLFSGTSHAADPVAPTTHDWTGVYAGIQGSYDFGQNRWSERGVPVSINYFALSGFSGGATLGVNKEIHNNIVLGLETDISATSINGTGFTSNGFSCITAAGCQTQVGWLGTARGRIGMALDNTMPYVTGGLAVGGVSGSFVNVNTAGSGTQVGWTAGAGIEHAFSDKLSAKVEYLYTDLGRLELPTNCGTRCYTDINFSMVRVGLNFKF